MSIQVSFADNITQKLIATLASKLPHADDLKLAVAFVSASGLSLIEPYLQQCIQRDGRAEFLVGLDLLTTEPKALKILHEMSQAGLPVTCFCYSDPSRPSASIYHPKLYLIAAEDEVTIVIGSSNLTKGGLKDNVEINAVVQAKRDDEIVSDIYAVYNSLKFQQPRVEPDAEFISLYEALHHVVERRSSEALKDSETKELMQRFNDKIGTLRRPKPTVGDLFGWQKIVFERLPTGTFKTSDIYTFEREFQRFYPENRNIEAKIRQILQQLRDLGLIEHPATNQWERKQ
ncbi:MAG: phospholipase D-like domain-containing protein [Dehalococcoidia bacterium]